MRVLIVLLGVLAMAPGAVACRCNYAGPFTTTMHQMPLVVRAEVTGYGPKLPHGETLYSTMKVKVLEVMSGELEVEELEVRGDPGHLCLEYINAEKFVEGRQVLLALGKVNEKKVDLMSCGERSVVVDGELVRGSTYVYNDDGGFAGREAYEVPLKTIRAELQEAMEKAKAAREAGGESESE